jgi:hypothetical protein
MQETNARSMNDRSNEHPAFSLGVRYESTSLLVFGQSASTANAQATKLQAAENDLKQLMVDVARAIEKAQEAVAKMAPKAVGLTTETESQASSR